MSAPAPLWRKAVAAALALAAAGAIWYGWENLNTVRRSVPGQLWDYRYLVLTIAAVLLLSLIERISPK